jgi:hypothetical protein
MGIADFFRQRNAYGGDNANAMAGLTQPDDYQPQSGAMPGMSLGYRNPNVAPDMFAGTRDIAPAPPDALAPPPDDSGTMNDLASVVTDNSRQTRDTDALRNQVSQYPDRANYKPSILRQIGSAFIGYDQGYGAQQKFKDAPYDEAVGDWSNKVKPLENLANLERYGNTDTTRQTIGSDRNAIAQERNRIAQEKVNVSQQRANDAQKKINAVIKNNDLTASEKAALTQKYNKELISAKADVARSLEDLKNTHRIGQIDESGDIQKDIQELRGEQGQDLAETRGAEARKTKAVVPGGAGATGSIPTQQAKAKQNRAGQALRDHPEWKGLISVDANGQVKIATPGSSFFGKTVGGPTQKVYDEIKQYIDGPGSSMTTDVPAGAGTPNNTDTQPSGAGTPNKGASAGAPSGAGSPNKPATTPTSEKPKGKAGPNGEMGISENGQVEPGYVAIASNATGKKVAQIPESNVPRLDKTKYHVVR